MRQHALTIFLLFFCNTLFADIQDDRHRFLQVYEQIKTGSVNDYYSLTKDLQHYILYPYLEHAYLKKHIKTAKATELMVFMKRFPNSILADDLRDQWLIYLSQQQQWKKILSYPIDKNASTAARCLYNQALINTGQTQRGLQKGKVLWQSKRVLPPVCDDLSKTLHLANKISQTEYWQRTANLMTYNQTTAAAKLAVYLSAEDQQRFKNWRAIHSTPKAYIKAHLGTGIYTDDSAHNRQILMHGLKRLLKKQNAYAQQQWQVLKNHYHFTPQEQGDMDSALYYPAARNHEADALVKLQKIPAQYRSVKANLWMARLAIRLGHWSKVLDAIHAMAQKTQQDTVWVYWKARALQQLKQPKVAQQLLQRNAKNITYYGLLSADRLKQDYSVLKTSKPDRSYHIAQVKKSPAIQRALELFRIGKTTLASKEWFKALSYLNKASQLAAAELALQQGQAFTAILTVSKTKDWNVADLRFPLLYKQLILNHATQQKVDPAWVYGIMRRESAFKNDALSRVKAFGLMQLMPATAKEVAGKLGLKNLGRKDFIKADTNIQLGSRYLSQMYKRFMNYPKATAAYNAGVGRVKRWTPTQRLAADQWIESIPFDETRKYVQSVMAYTTIYDYKLRANRARKLSQRLLPILPEPILLPK